MLKPLLKISHRTLVVTLETLAVVALLVAIAFGAFVWRVSQGPVSIGFAKDYVEEALSNEEEGLVVTFDDMVFSWPELNGPFLLDLSGLHVQQGKEASNSLTIDKASVGLSRRALIIGLIRPVSVVINAPSLELVRTRDGKLSLLVQKKKEVVAEEQKIEQEPANAGQDVAQLFKDMANRSGGKMISRLRTFEIRGASVAVRDYQYGLSWYLSDLDFAMKRHPQGVAASLLIMLPGGRDGNAANIAMDMVYRKESDDFKVEANITDLNPYVVSKFMTLPDALSGQDLYFSGKLGASLDTNLVPTDAQFSAEIPEGQVTIAEQFDGPIALKNIKLDSDYNAANKVLNVSNLSGELGGIPFKGAGKGIMTDASLSMPIALDVSALELKDLPPLFPKSEQDGEAYKWLAHKLQGGTFSNVSLAMELAAQKTVDTQTNIAKWDVDVPVMKLNFAFDGTKVIYSDTLMPIENAKGTGTLDLGAEVLDIKGESGMIGDMTGSEITVKVTHLMTAKSGDVAVHAKVKGPMATALNYIAAEPINMTQEEIGLDPKKVKGTIEAVVDVSLPTVKDVPKELVNVDINGVLTDLDIPGIVQGLPLTGGPLTLVTEPGGFKIKGNAKLAGREAVIDWHQYFESKGNPYSMKVVAQIGADQELRNHFGVNLDDYISGTMPVDVTYISKGDGTSSVDVKGDLNPVRVYISPFKFEKPVGMPGSVVAKANLKDDVLKDITGIDIKSRDFSVTGAKLSFAKQNGKTADLSKATLSEAVIGNTKMKVDLDVSAANVMTVKASGPVFDLVPFLTDTEHATPTPVADIQKAKQQPMKITMTADKMLGKNDQVVSGATTYLEMDADGDITQIEMDGKIGTAGNLAVRFKPDAAGKRTFRLQSDDAGAVLHTFGLYSNVHGGSLVIYGEPKGKNLRGDLYGVARMENFRVVKAPALASLLSLMSLTGVSNALGGEGLVFSKLESPFEWRFREEGNLLIIKDGTTSGSAIGLTFSGVVDRGKKTTDVAGTIIPMTEINSFLSKIPLVGEILGGSTGLFAATYSMKGPSNDPKVSVNPLSIITPGIIRRILFEGGYESKIPEDEKKEEAPAPQKVVAPAKQQSQTASPKAATN